MSYCLDINSPLVPSESDYFRLLDKLFYCFTRPVIFKWATTQVCVLKRYKAQLQLPKNSADQSVGDVLKWYEAPYRTQGALL